MLSKLTKLITEESSQYFVFLGMVGIVLILTVVVYSRDPASFQRYFGAVHPLIVLLGLSIIGLVLFSILLADGTFAIYRNGNIQGVLIGLGLAIPFAVVMILVDRMYPFPADMNVPIPEAILFYPAIGFVVELLFHLLPFCLIYFSLAALFQAWGNPSVIWVAILIVALLEPAFQVYFTAGGNTPGVVAYVGVHLLLFNLVQLLLFRRYDFVTMYAFRFSYYILWHILWGHLRLNLLF